MSFKDSGYVPFTAAEALEEGQRVVLREGGLLVADATQAGIGVNRFAAESGAPAGVALWNKPGTMEVLAAGPVGIGQAVFAAAGGAVGTLPTAEGAYTQIGVAVTACEEAGDLLEVCPVQSGKTETVSGEGA